MSKITITLIQVEHQCGAKAWFAEHVAETGDGQTVHRSGHWPTPLQALAEVLAFVERGF